MYIANAKLVEFINDILSSGQVGIKSTTNLSAEKEMKLVCKMNGKISGSKGPNFSKLLMECELYNSLTTITKNNKKRKITVKWTAPDSPMVAKRILELCAKLEEQKDIISITFTTGRSIVMWLSYKTDEVLQTLRSIIESGDLQICLTVIFTLLSDSSEELKVNIKEYTTDLKWAEDYFQEKG